MIFIQSDRAYATSFYIRQVRSHIRYSTFNIRKNYTNKKVEVRTKAAHLKCATVHLQTRRA